MPNSSGLRGIPLRSDSVRPLGNLVGLFVAILPNIVNANSELANKILVSNCFFEVYAIFFASTDRAPWQADIPKCV